VIVEVRSPALLNPCGKLSGQPGPATSKRGVGRAFAKSANSSGKDLIGTCPQIKTAAGANLLVALIMDV
jgi:hypothetical protein